MGRTQHRWTSPTTPPLHGFVSSCTGCIKLIPFNMFFFWVYPEQVSWMNNGKQHCGEGACEVIQPHVGPRWCSSLDDNSDTVNAPVQMWHLGQKSHAISHHSQSLRSWLFPQSAAPLCPSSTEDDTCHICKVPAVSGVYKTVSLR